MQDKPFLEHLEDLRFVLLKSALVVLGFTVLGFVFAPFLMKFVLWPFHAAVSRFDLTATDDALLRTLRPSGAFVVSMKMALGAGFTLALPFVLWFFGRFVFPGLTNVEKRYVLPALATGTGLFLVGLSFCFFVILPTALGFFWSYGQKMGIANEWTVEYYVALVVQMLLAFGVVFELPVVLMFLVKVGIVGHEGLRKARKFVIVGIFVLAALITPTPDVLSQISLAVPMMILYESCVWMSRWVGAKK